MAYIVDTETKKLHTEECAKKNVPAGRHQHFSSIDNANGKYTSKCSCVK